MILNLFATTVAALLLFLSFSNALFLDSSVHFARHQQIAARRSPVKRSSGSARCKARSPPSISPSSVAVAVAVATPQSIPSTSSSPPAPSPSSSPSSGKVGLAWALGDNPALKNFITPKVSSIYTWDAHSPPDRFGLEYCAMLWGGSTEEVADFQNTVKAGYTNCVYGPNEPNLDTQSNLDPTTAAQLWMQNILPLSSQGYTSIWAPAVTSADSGVPWLQAFFKACQGCTFTGMNLHIYATNSADMINYLMHMHSIFNKDIRVTEFACESFTNGPQCTQDQAFAFMSNVTEWMDQTDYIKKYFAYGIMTDININPLDRLMADDGTPTALGRLYLGS